MDIQHAAHEDFVSIFVFLTCHPNLRPDWSGDELLRGEPLAAAIFTHASGT